MSLMLHSECVKVAVISVCDVNYFCGTSLTVVEMLILTYLHVHTYKALKDMIVNYLCMHALCMHST